MNEITLARALKLKNRLAEDLQILYERFRSCNSYRADSPPDYNSLEVLAQIEQKTSNLIELKTAIQKANSPILDKIFRLSELKSFINQLHVLPSRKGIIEVFIGLENKMKEIEHIATIDEIGKNDRIVRAKKEIDNLQEELDAFNAVNKINISFKM